MGLFSSLTNQFRPYGWDSRADGLPGEQIGILMEMERQIKESARIDAAIREAAQRIASGDRDWYWTINTASVHDVQRERMEKAAIAEAFKTLKGNQ